MPLPVDAIGSFATDFRAGLGSGAIPAGVTLMTRDGAAPDSAALRARFAVYRNNVMHSLTRALARRFPVIERLVGRDFFTAMAAEFIRVHPPASPVLIHWGGAFPDFLRDFPPAQSLTYLPDVARIEVARGQSYHAADIAAITPEELGKLGQPVVLSLQLAPSVRLIRCAHSAVSIWRANQPGADPALRKAVLGQGTEHALIYRRRDFQVPLHQLSPQESAFVGALMQGVPLGHAADNIAADPTPILCLLIGEGLIAAAHEETAR